MPAELVKLKDETLARQMKSELEQYFVEGQAKPPSDGCLGNARGCKDVSGNLFLQFLTKFETLT
jgi:hypothetical protein